MASGDTLYPHLLPSANEYGAADAAMFATRTGIPMLVFTQDVSDDAIWTLKMPQHYSASPTGIDVLLEVTSPATTGNMDWDVALMRLTAQNIDTAAFATAISVDNTNVSASVGIPIIVTVSLLAAEMDAVVRGDLFSIKITRDGSPDTTADDLQLLSVEIRET